MKDFDELKALQQATGQFSALEALRRQEEQLGIASGRDLPVTQQVFREAEAVKRIYDELEAVKRLSDQFETVKRVTEQMRVVTMADIALQQDRALMQHLRLEPKVRQEWLDYLKSPFASPAFGAQLRTPALAEIEQALARPFGGGFRDVLDQTNSLRDLAERVASITQPWVRMQAEQESIEAAVRLTGIGEALRVMPPFDLELVSKLRVELGDWGAAPEPTAQVYASPEARVSYYEDRGLNRSLTDFSDGAFAQTLDVAQLCENYLEDTDLAAFVPQELNPELAAAERRGVLCFQLLRALEIELRAFVDRLMTAQYGSDWYNRMGPEMKKTWDTTAAARNAGGHEIKRLIEVADFTDYEKIIVRGDHFKTVFRPYFLESYSVQESFRRLRPLRNQTMHAGPVTKEDLLFVVTECTRIRNAIVTTVT